MSDSRETSVVVPNEASAGFSLSIHVADVTILNRVVDIDQVAICSIPWILASWRTPASRISDLVETLLPIKPYLASKRHLFRMTFYFA